MEDKKSTDLIPVSTGWAWPVGPGLAGSCPRYLNCDPVVTSGFHAKMEWGDDELVAVLRPAVMGFIHS